MENDNDAFWQNRLKPEYHHVKVLHVYIISLKTFTFLREVTDCFDGPSEVHLEKRHILCCHPQK